MTSRIRRFRRTGLWREPAFLNLWVGQTVSICGSEVTVLALPLTAVLTLHASALQMGLLAAAERTPFLVISLFAGVWVDRRQHRSILIWSDLGRALILACIPVAAALGILHIEYLYGIALFVGMLTVFFDVAYHSFLPVLVGRDKLIEGNTKLEISSSTAQIAGPGVAGALVQLVTAPTAILVDAASFIVSVAFLLRIRLDEPLPEISDQLANIWQEIGEGVRSVLGSRLLRPITLCGATHNFVGSMLSAVFVLYMSRTLGLHPFTIGLTFAVGSVGGLIGAAVGGRVSHRFGIGRTISGSQLLTAVGIAFIPLAGGPHPLLLALLGVSQMLWGMSRPMYNITQVSLRQAVTPTHLLGRMNASMRFVTWGVMPVGALFGGLLGSTIGPRPTLIIVVAGEVLAALWVLVSPVLELHEAPMREERESVLV